MKKHRKWIQISIMIAVILVGAFTIGSSLIEEKEKIPAVGDKAPDFTLKSLAGDIQNLSDYKGKLVVLNFWGTFCPPCVDETPLLQHYYELYKDREVVFLGVNLNEATATVQGFVRQFEVTYPILMDKEQVRKQYGVNRFPTTFFILPDGTIAEKWIGEIREEQLKPRLERYLAAKG